MITRRDFLKATAAGSAFLSVGHLAEAQSRLQSFIRDPQYCKESSRRIPVIEDTDIVIVGGSSGAVAAAVAARRAGSKVF